MGAFNLLVYSFIVPRRSLSTSQKSCLRKQILQRKRPPLLLLLSWRFPFSIEPLRAFRMSSKIGSCSCLFLHLIEACYSDKSWLYCSDTVTGPRTRPLPPPPEVRVRDSSHPDSSPKTQQAAPSEPVSSNHPFFLVNFRFLVKSKFELSFLCSSRFAPFALQIQRTWPLDVAIW